ncbi:uncharacterized protein L969DRAFT_89478 [Mixia osmundae IAM 14324]|uniref:uncharacterized protein n=1 Tax=Mixia osmundae (strain CBS 9802 / IAM 14324 / JCM 22182 / KY 12970) TaxID=764103 RepID=UPI0004A54BEC|nr:uncharacterized protein L969DRAFT_89478 [Mixia osmundae IAM 14324]KEI37527.1 hypothetical protein L969DRAFT_89478 [Mixia osmundae IAM 14324]
MTEAAPTRSLAARIKALEEAKHRQDGASKQREDLPARGLGEIRSRFEGKDNNALVPKSSFGLGAPMPRIPSTGRVSVPSQAKRLASLSAPAIDGASAPASVSSLRAEAGSDGSASPATPTAEVNASIEPIQQSHLAIDERLTDKQQHAFTAASLAQYDAEEEASPPSRDSLSIQAALDAPGFAGTTSEALPALSEVTNEQPALFLSRQPAADASEPSLSAASEAVAPSDKPAFANLAGAATEALDQDSSLAHDIAQGLHVGDIDYQAIDSSSGASIKTETEHEAVLMSPNATIMPPVSPLKPAPPPSPHVSHGHAAHERDLGEASMDSDSLKSTPQMSDADQFPGQAALPMPTVKCSDCSDEVALDDLSEHVCRARLDADVPADDEDDEQMARLPTSASSSTIKGRAIRSDDFALQVDQAVPEDEHEDFGYVTISPTLSKH